MIDSLIGVENGGPTLQIVTEAPLKFCRAFTTLTIDKDFMIIIAIRTIKFLE